ncbi:hypothetical protein [Bacillus sp. ISL-4]|nr:hypothetical protein [Bacillus sp. ISL-4]
MALKKGLAIPIILINEIVALISDSWSFSKKEKKEIVRLQCR